MGAVRSKIANCLVGIRTTCQVAQQSSAVNEGTAATEAVVTEDTTGAEDTVYIQSDIDDAVINDNGSIMSDVSSVSFSSSTSDGSAVSDGSARSDDTVITTAAPPAARVVNGRCPLSLTDQEILSIATINECLAFIQALNNIVGARQVSVTEAAILAKLRYRISQLGN